MRDLTGSWLTGPSGSLPDGQAQEWRGQRLGLPQNGPASLPTMVNRIGAIFVDWLLCLALAYLLAFQFQDSLFGGDPLQSISAWLTYVLFFVYGTVCVWLFAQTPGQAICGLGVARVDYPDERVGLWRSALRMALIMTVLPALVQDEDGRGLHDRGTGTAVIRSR